MIRFWIVQHGDKVVSDPPESDPGLTERGRRRARLTGEYLATEGIAHLYSSPLRRAQETAEIVGVALSLDVRVDDRVRERMNWGDGGVFPALDDFLAEWRRATEDRDYRPPYGDSSRAAGERFAVFLAEVTEIVSDGASVGVVSHGGVTVDLVRTLCGDERVMEANAAAIDRGLPSCGISRLEWDGKGYHLLTLGDTAHLEDHGAA